MGEIDRSSLASTLDAINAALFWGRPLSKSQREEASEWIAARQGGPGSYRRFMFAPTPRDFEEGIALFTGETIRTRAGMAHVLGEEACRALILLDVSTPAVRAALHRASAEIVAMLDSVAAGYAWRDRPGEFCCGTCTTSLWRHFAAGGLRQADRDRWLEAGMKALKAHRLGSGRWRRFPFWYALLALSELDIPSAGREMRYAAPACQRYLKLAPKDGEIGRRRRLLAEKILTKC